MPICTRQTPVMAGLVPAIHVFGPSTTEVVDARNKSGHDACMELAA